LLQWMAWCSVSTASTSCLTLGMPFTGVCLHCQRPCS
jgi:hypothetical protein